MIIFKKVIRYLKQINREIILGNSDEESLKILKRKQKLLDEIRTYMVSYTWVKHSIAREKLACFIENDFDYRVLEREFGITYESARASISQLGKQFEKEIGDGIVDTIMYGNVSVAEAELVQSFSAFRGLLVSDLRPLLPDGKISNEVDLLDCRKELSLLQFYTSRRLNDGVNRLDMQKLSHIVAILEDNSTEYSFEKEILMGYLSGDVKKWEDMENLLQEVLHYSR